MPWSVGWWLWLLLYWGWCKCRYKKQTVASLLQLVLALPFKIARYAIYDDAIIAVRINTNDNGINKNYKVNKTSVRRRAFV